MKKNEIRIIDGYNHHYIGEIVHYEPKVSMRGWECRIIKFIDKSNGDFIAKKLKQYDLTKFNCIKSKFMGKNDAKYKIADIESKLIFVKQNLKPELFDSVVKQKFNKSIKELSNVDNNLNNIK